MSEAVRVPENYQYLRPDQENSLKSEASQLEGWIKNPSVTGVDKGEMARRKRAVEKMLSDQEAPDLNPAERDAWSKEARRLEGEFSVGMPSAEEMRKNPPGAVDRNLAWHRRHNRSVMRWKNIQRALHKGDTSPDIANVERFRRHTQPGDLSMVGAQIPGRLFVGTNPSEAYKENYERIFGDPQNKQEEPKSEASATKRSGSTNPGKKVAMLCGELKDPRGRMMHEKRCPKCAVVRSAPKQEAAEASPAAE